MGREHLSDPGEGGAAGKKFPIRPLTLPSPTRGEGIAQALIRGVLRDAQALVNVPQLMNETIALARFQTVDHIR